MPFVSDRQKRRILPTWNRIQNGTSYQNPPLLVKHPFAFKQQLLPAERFLSLNNSEIYFVHLIKAQFSLSGASFNISFLCFHLTSAIIVSKAYHLVYKSNVVPLTDGCGIDPRHRAVKNSAPILYCIEANCAWKGLSWSSALSHPSCRLWVPSCVLYQVYHTAVHYCSHAKPPRRDVLQSSLSEWHFNKKS